MPPRSPQHNPTPASTPAATPAVPPVTPAAAAAAGSRPNSLDPLESTVGDSDVQRFLAEKPAPAAPPVDEFGPDLTGDQCFRHAGWEPIRRRVRASLFRTGQTGRRVEAFDQCGDNAWIEQNCDDSELFRVKCNRCHDRLCTPCANERAYKIRDALCRQMGDAAHSFITLTLSGRGESLTELVDRLYRSFRYLRSHPVWENAVTGGAAFLEIKWNHKSSRWHPHLHIICVSKFLPQHTLSDAWRSITKDSFIVDIRRISAKATQIGYVTKYASKPLNTSFASVDDRMDEAVIALKGRRLCLTFGSWYGTPLTVAEEEELDDEAGSSKFWRPVASLHDIFTRAALGDPDAEKIWQAIGGPRRIAAIAGGNSS